MTSPHQQKLRISGPVIITANRLTDGAVVHRTGHGSWSESLGDAEILRDAVTAQQALRQAQGEGLVAVGPYIAPVDLSQSEIEAGNLREFIRATGPTFALPSDVQKPRSRADLSPGVYSS